MPLEKDLIAHPDLYQLVLELTDTELQVMSFSHFEPESLIFERLPLDLNKPSRLAALEDVVYDNPLLLADFASVTVLLRTTRSLVLPLSIADTDAGLSLFRRVFPPDSSRGRDEFLSTPMPLLASALCFEVEADVVNFFRRTFHNCAITHPLAPLAQYFKAKNPGASQGRMLVSINGTNADVCILGHTEPQLLVTYECRQTIDALYYIMAARQQWGLDENQEIMVAGDSAARASLMSLLRRYVRYVMPVVFPSGMHRAGRRALSVPFEIVTAPIPLQ